ncbi:MAG: ABC transporter permease [Alphaproteobacteria bacterium]|jgi:general nucleoside transport system permease protein|nr:ABC transporter permease [Alphaproteobacteria bacterium]MBT4017159.1 ABC transporter permease [Alphaproteobacteria bacterium]MBT4966245.1 ABC transporter permease [Alphaproteobacteria bacterium]MBT5159192.1 ABC transporter permease [Alphaproteobacteria bacterium]MBT5917091.1 ABC transporter permease [Alphaproteobacteria bacterium]
MNGIEWIVPVVLTVITASTPLVFAAIGELVTEKSGVLNLGVEGMMLVGAVSAFAVASSTGSGSLGIIAGAAAGALMAAIFGWLTLTLLANQVATGLALTIFGVGFSALIGSAFVGFAIEPLPKLNLPGLSEIPIVGPLLFGQDFLVYLSFASVFAVGWFLKNSHGGMVLRAVGESHDSAHAIGYNVIGIRYLATMFGGAMSGLGGAYLSLVYTPMWAENMTSGRGWIALALVVFATWRPGRLILGAYMFGGITILQLNAQGLGLDVPSQLMSMLPYLATIVVLVLISRDQTKIRLNAPACLSQPFRPAH